MMYFFDCSLPDVKLIRRPASRATSVNVTGNGRPEGAARTAGGASRVAGPCAAAKIARAAARTSKPRIEVIRTIVIAASGARPFFVRKRYVIEIDCVLR